MSEISDLVSMWQNNREDVEKILATNASVRKLFIDLDETFRAGEGVTVDGFKRAYTAFYNGRPFPYVAEAATEEFTWAYHNRKGVMFEGWRGFGKSTYFAAWCPYVIGVNPLGSTALARVNDAKGKEMGKTIADLIASNPGWQRIFSHVVPDYKAGWSVENGFNVMDIRITGVPGSDGFDQRYALWRMRCFADHLSEKSLLTAGIESGSIIGLHPTNGFWFDDLHDELNTRSQSELKRVTDIVQGNIIPTWFSAGGSPTLGVFCTPWSKNPPDAYQVMLATGLFKHVKMPIYVEDPNGEPIPATSSDGHAIDPEYAGKKVKLTWKEAFPAQRVADMIKAYGTRFGQMCLCDIDLSKPRNMRYQTYPAHEIKWREWPMILGVDPVGWVKGVSSGQGISHFAAAQLLKTPYNTLVIGDGFVEKIDALQGEERVAEIQRTFAKTYKNASIETNGAGAMWIAMITRNKNIKYHGHNVGELGAGNKKQRQYSFLQPLFASGAILVSDAETPFLNAVREYMDNFPNFPDDSYLLDVGDALVMGAYDVPEIWTKIVVNADQSASRDSIFGKLKPKVDPWAALLDGRR